MKRPARKAKRARFVRTAERRTQNVLRRIRCLARIAKHRRYYEYDDADIEAIFTRIQRDVDVATGRFGRRAPL